MRLMSYEGVDLSRANLKNGRVNQKLRTRTALIEAAADLATQGRAITVQDVAEAANVSRATAYRYFPNPDSLLLETQLHTLVKMPKQLFPDDRGAPAERVRRVLDHLQGMTRENEPAFRQFMRGTMDRWLEEGGRPKAPLRAGRRLELLRVALEPFRQRMKATDHERLVDALAMLVSLETYFAGTDVCGLSPRRISGTLAWVIEVLVDASLEPGTQT